MNDFWIEIGAYLRNRGVIQNISDLGKKSVILGNTLSPIVNHVIVVGKSMIDKKYRLSISTLLGILKRDMSV